MARTTTMKRIAGQLGVSITTVSKVLNNRDELILSVVSEADAAQFETIATEVADTLKDKLGVKIAVEVVEPGAIDHLTEVNLSPKLKRFRDERG